MIYRFLYALRHNNANNMTIPPPPVTCCISRFSPKSIVFRKKIKCFQLRIKQANCILEELSNLYWIVLLMSFFPLLLWITAENRTKLEKLFIWTTKPGGAQHQKQTNCASLFIRNCNNACDFWTERNFCIISDCRNSFNDKIKNLQTSKKFL